MAKTTVRLTIFGPDHEHECDESEIPALRAQGLLIEDKPEAKAPVKVNPAAAGSGAAATKEN